MTVESARFALRMSCQKIWYCFNVTNFVTRTRQSLSDTVMFMIAITIFLDRSELLSVRAVWRAEEIISSRILISHPHGRIP